jgi:hypothetical protein
MEEGQSIIDEWITSGEVRGSLTHDLKKIYELQAKFLFKHYEPFKGSREREGGEFIRRVDRWLTSFTDPDDRWSAFNSLRFFLFVGPEETAELYRVAVETGLKRWLVDTAGIDIFDECVDLAIEQAIQSCWPCPVTDSLRINSLLHITGLSSKDLRPDWYSLRKLGDSVAINQYVADNSIKYLALFEDFVGSGGQCMRTIKYALDTFNGPIFFSPLVICSPGDEKLRELERSSAGRLSYRPIVVLTADCLVQKSPHANEPKSFSALRKALRTGYEQIDEILDGEEYGWKGVGCLYSSYSNCPNNTPPIFQHQNANWKNPIFPRLKRI